VLLLAGVGLTAVSSRHDYGVLAWAGTLRGIYALRRGIQISLAIFIVGVAWFFRKYHPVKMPPNLIAHTRVTGFLFVATAIRTAAFNSQSVNTEVIQIAMLAIRSACFLAWAICLSSAGEHFERPKVSAGQVVAVREAIDQLKRARRESGL
jgi:hypothetical protein